MYKGFFSLMGLVAMILEQKKKS